jgi:hypothetical protein
MAKNDGSLSNGRNSFEFNKKIKRFMNYVSRLAAIRLSLTGNAKRKSLPAPSCTSVITTFRE